MSVRESIEKKKRGTKLSKHELEALVSGFLDGGVPDYQMAAFLMAVWFRGLDAEETLELTRLMWRSGKILDLSDVTAPKIDKHSTGGVGDKVSLPLIGIAMACGLCVPMLSGRGLGHTGGTLDKLESIPGYSTDFDEARYRKTLKSVGGSIVGQSAELVPADRELYALRDVTATVDSIPLIVASILSKKFAAGVDGVVLDVKVGSGAFMKTPSQAGELAGALLAVGQAFEKKISVLLTRMDEPLGAAVGNAIEVIEAVDLLRNQGPEDLNEVTRELVVRMLLLGGLAQDSDTARSRVNASIANGSALKCFQRLVEAHGGNLDWQAADCGLDLAPVMAEVTAPRESYLKSVDGYEVGMVVVDLGGGRQRKEESVDSGVGLHWELKIGQKAQPGQTVVRIRARHEAQAAAAVRRLQASVGWSETPVEAEPVVLGDFD